MHAEIAWRRLRAVHWALAFAFPAISIALAQPTEMEPLLLLAIQSAPFAIGAVLMRRVAGSGDTLWGMLGATALAFVVTAVICGWLAWRAFTGWRGGADIGLGLVVMAYPLLIGPIMLLGFGSGITLHRQLRGRITTR